MLVDRAARRQSMPLLKLTDCGEYTLVVATYRIALSFRREVTRELQPQAQRADAGSVDQVLDQGLPAVSASHPRRLSRDSAQSVFLRPT